MKRRMQPALATIPGAALGPAKLRAMERGSRGASKKRTAGTAAAMATRLAVWPYCLGAAAGLLAVIWAYSSAVHTGFLFDDAVLPYTGDGMPRSLAAWLRSTRPTLMFTYWINARFSGSETFSYHVFNLIIHAFSSGMVFCVVRRILEWSGIENTRRTGLAGFAALLFLLHPVQTESVAYLAGRSEALSDGLAWAAFAVFLWRKETAITWARATAVLALSTAALLAKQQTVVLPALLMLTDWYWNPGFCWTGIRRNWRLYLPMAAGAVGAVAFFWSVITHANSAGFGVQDFTWYQYFFTQCRALFVYLGIFVLPVQLNADWDFPISKTILDHGAIVGLIALLFLTGLAWRYRRRFPLASYGYFVYLLLMAPTSSILPILDPVAERRLYFGMLGLLLILADVLQRLPIGKRALAVACGLVLLLATGVTHSRAEVWSGAVPLWEDTVRKSPNKWRDHFQLANAYFNAGRCAPAETEFERTAQMEPPAYDLLVGWGLAYDCLGRTEDALSKMRQAAALSPMAHVYTQIGLVYAKRQRWTEALDALATAERMEPGFYMTYYYRGNVRLATNHVEAAIQDYERTLVLRPNFEPALQGLAIGRARLRATP